MLLLIHASAIIWITTNVRSQFVSVNSTSSKRVIQLGALFVKDNPSERLYTGYRTSASAINIAIDRLRREGMFLETDFNLTILYDECDENLAAGHAVELIQVHKVDAIIGPTCNDPAVAVGVLGSYYNLPIMLWGSATAGVLLGTERFGTSTLLTATSRYLATAVYNLCVEFGWNQFVFLYNQFNDNGKCFTMQNDFLTVLNQYSDVDMAYTTEIIDLNPEPLRNALRAVSLRGRIFVICADDDSIKLLIMTALNDLEVNSNEYVYIFADTRSKGFTIPVEGAKDKLVWETGNSSQIATEEGRIAARNAFRNAIFVVDMMGQGTVQENFSVFGNEVIDRMKDAPLFCTTDCEDQIYRKAAQYAGQLHDAMYSYGIALNRTIADDPSRYRDGTFIVQHMLQSFQGLVH
ncbi:hypothetical protein WR25_12113 [Diploscapter pachys]|uniref:guanylate cyclase n=1 Tax=Diploscapter pachys TaxID=2018661 RepID=A0A2A2JH08_9BILA|nr:hypothetical protein WR25_12113 [Diploscapter pachys]